MRRREEIRRRRFAREEQPAIDRRRQHRAVAGMAGQRMRIGAAGEGIVGPARFGERLQLAPDIVAEKACDLVDALGREGAIAGVFNSRAKLPPKKPSMQGWPNGRM